jgi:hypothetical protein
LRGLLVKDVSRIVSLPQALRIHAEASLQALLRVSKVCTGCALAAWPGSIAGRGLPAAANGFAKANLIGVEPQLAFLPRIECIARIGVRFGV